ncbi:MAG: TerB N-terminal domain-containing protein [Rhizobiales bacterium]|nr:TerB N-terminal domain-containing protein [Hyphomicrobiales bacterium]
MKFRTFLVLVVAASLLGQTAAVPAVAAERSVRDIQKALADKGFRPGAPDGVWGKKSIAALRAYQTANGLPSTGTADQATIDRLFPPPPSVEAQQLAITVKQAIGMPGKASPAVETRPLDLPSPSPVESASEMKAVDNSGLPEQAPPAQQVSGTPATVEESTRRPAMPQPSATSSPVIVQLGQLALFGLAVAAVFVVAKRRKRRRQASKASSANTVSENSPTSELIWDDDSFRALTAQDAIPQAVPPVSPKDQAASLEAHNRNVADWVRTNASKTKPVGDGSKDDLTEITERGPKASVVDTAIPSPTGSLSNFNHPKAAETKPAPSAASGDDAAKRMAGAEWIAPGKAITVATLTISGGMFYLGGVLGKQGRLNENENCLVNPALTVGRGRDPAGVSMGYWPSYGGMSPDARRSYLEWLAGSRSNPGDYIGYVFLYFYGLERRLLLDQDATDGEAVLAEVRRLLDVYGHNGSFNRYATELLTAAELRSGEPSTQFLERVESNGYEVPAAIKIALGIRVRDERPIEADLMLRFALTHPETSVRTPAKRVPALLQELYHLEFAKLYPSGYRPRAGRTKKLKKHYQACSGSFGLDIKVLGGEVPDITDREEPIRIARRIFNDCMEQLNDYSRTLGRLPGLEPNLLAISKLPEALRLTAANGLAGDPLATIRRYTEAAVETQITFLAGLVGLDMGQNPGKAKLRDLSQALSSFGIGSTFDPAFAVRSSAGDDKAILFPISQPLSAEASEAYRIQQLSVMLGMLVGHADGVFHELERKALLDRIAGADDLSPDEKRRLEAEMRLNEGDAARLDEWFKRLKDVPESGREVIAAELVSLASADGDLHADEVRKLEVIFKRMGIDHTFLYERLHASASSQYSVGAPPIPSDASKSKAFPSRSQIDLSRLQSIRSETRITSNVLADIFVDEDEDVVISPSEVVMDVRQSELFEGLEQRYGAFLSEILQRPSWSKEDFEHLARDASLMPGAAKEAINDWSLDRFDELMIEGDDELDVNQHLLPIPTAISTVIKEGISA